MKTLHLLTISLFLASSSMAQKEGDAVLGHWFTAEKDAKIEIYTCGDRYCGRIMWLEEPNEEDGTPKVDDENPKEELRNRKLLGLEILTGFAYDEDYEWEDGDIYDPKSGNTYSCLMELSDDKKFLEVRGYIGFSLFGRTEVWTRAKP